MATPKRRLPAPLYAVEKKIRTFGMDPRAVAWDDYLIPGLDEEVLRNKVGLKHEPYGCTDKAELRRREERFSAFRIAGLKQNPIDGDFSFAHMQAIHREIFQDVYAWAGEVRTVDMAKQDHGFMANEQIESLWGKVARKLQADDRLQGIADGGEFAEKLAFYWGRVNVIHAFREGNTRAQVIFFDQLTEQAGWHLDVARLAPNHPDSVYEEFVAARFHHQDNGFDEAPLARVLGKVLAPIETLEQRLERASTPSVEQERWAPRPADQMHVAQKLSSLDPSPDEYENPDKMRTAHRRIGTQENTPMAIDPSKEPERSSFDPHAVWRERQENRAKTERIREAQERFGITPHPSPALDRPGNMHTALMAKQAAERAQPARPQRLPHDPLPRRQGARVLPPSRDTDAPVPMPVASEPDLDPSFWDEGAPSTVVIGRARHGRTALAAGNESPLDDFADDGRYPTADEVKQWEADFDPADPSGDIAREAARKAAGRPVFYPTPAPTPGRGKHRAPIFEDTSAASKDDDYGPSL